MACGRLKNLEIAARNLLCSLGDRRRNFLTTRDGNRRRGNPEPPGKGQLQAFGQGEVRRHRQGGNSEPPVRGKPRATRQRTTPGFRARRSPAPPARRKLRATGAGETPSHPAKDNSRLSGKEKSGATGKEETPSHRCGGNPGPPGIGQTLGPLVPGGTRCHPARGEPARGNFGPPAQGKLRRYVAEGKPRVRCGEESSGPPAKGKLQIVRRRGNPELRDEKKALSHPAKGKLEPFDLGKPRSFGEKKALSHWCGKYLAPPGLGETPARWQRGKPEPRRGEHPSHPVIRSTGTPGAFLALVGGRAAQRTLRNRRDGAARLGEAPPSHTWRGLVLCLPCLVPLCPTGQNRARTDTPPPPFPVAAAGGSALAVQFAGADVASRPPWAGLAPLAGSRAGRAGRQAARVDGGAGPGQCPGHRRAAIVRQGSSFRTIF